MIVGAIYCKNPIKYRDTFCTPLAKNSNGNAVAAYALGYAVFAFIAGPISDRFDRKCIMVIGLIAFATSTFLCGIARNFTTMIIFRFLAGVSASFVTPQVWASIPVLIELSSNLLTKTLPNPQYIVRSAVETHRNH